MTAEDAQVLSEELAELRALRERDPRLLGAVAAELTVYAARMRSGGELIEGQAAAVLHLSRIAYILQREDGR